MDSLLSTPQLLTEITVFRRDGSIKMRRVIEPPKTPPDTVTFRVRDAQGSIVRELQVPIQSWLANWAKVFGTAGLAYTNVSVTNYDNTSYSLLKTSDVDMAGAAGENTRRGIQVGTDDGSITPLAITNYELGARIAHGLTSETLDFGQQFFTAPSISDTTCTLRLWRTFTNLSGATITVKEAGLYAYAITGKYIMFIRDLNDAEGIPINVPIANNQTLEVAYDISVTQASGYVQNLLKLLDSTWSNNSTKTYVDTSGVTRADNQTLIGSFRADAAAENSLYGIVVGTSNTALALTRYNLEAQIVHGETAGRLFYGAPEFEAYWADGSDMYTAVKRTFSNHSGGNITVEEAGIYTLTTFYAMIARTLTGGVILNDAAGEHEAMQIRYIIKHSL